MASKQKPTTTKQSADKQPTTILEPSTKETTLSQSPKKSTLSSKIITADSVKLRSPKQTTNPNTLPKIYKLCINMCIGGNSTSLDNAYKVLEQLTGQKPQYSKSRLTVRSFGIRRNEKIAVHCTVRGKTAESILIKALKIKEFELPLAKFSQNSIFGFGITEHIDLGISYDPLIGIFGMDFTVMLIKNGYRVTKRKRCRSKISNRQLVSKEEMVEWFKKEYEAYGGEVTV
ncbi:60S ribosomal protein L11-1 [Cucumispora dikerogammari]|nr:60S ribosomal protein L11-1 [Cucumispora dikerogammari]